VNVYSSFSSPLPLLRVVDITIIVVREKRIKEEERFITRRDGYPLSPSFFLSFFRLM